MQNTLTGNDGNDFLRGNGGDDTIDGGAGFDIAGYSGSVAGYSVVGGVGSVTVSGPDGTDTLTGIELLQFGDAYRVFGGATNLANVSLLGGLAVTGGMLDNQVTLGANAAARLIDLGGGNDTLTIALGGPTPQSIGLNVANVETINSVNGSLTVSLTSVLNGTTVDLGAGSDALFLHDANNVVTTIGVENITAAGAGNDTVTFVGDGTVGQSFNLGGGTDVLNLAGPSGTFGFSLMGPTTVVGQTTGGDEDVSLVNVQSGSTFDLGAGTNDALHLFNDGVHVNVVTVKNVENVGSVGFDSDQIHIAGNSGGVTTVTGGGGSDMIWASADVDHFRYAFTSDSSYDVPGAGQRDIVHDFDTSQDQFVFDHIAGATSLTWELIDFAGASIVRVDLNGDASGEWAGRWRSRWKPQRDANR